MTEEMLKVYGFDSCSEYHQLIASVDLSTSQKRADFKAWQWNDGTKEGLLKLPKEQACVMTWTDTLVYLALWIGVCLVLFYGSWPAIVGAALIACIDHKATSDRVSKAYDAGFEIGKKSVKPVYRSDQAAHQATFCYADGRLFRVGRDC